MATPRKTYKAMLVAVPYRGKLGVSRLKVPDEVEGAGYGKGGQPVKTVWEGAHLVAFHPVRWLNSTMTAAGAVIYDEATDLVVKAIDFYGDVSTTRGAFTLSGHKTRPAYVE